MNKLSGALALSSLVLAVPAFATPEPAPASSEEAKLKCKKFLETGSLIKKRKVCRTSKQWAQISDNEQDRGREMRTLVSAGRRE